MELINEQWVFIVHFQYQGEEIQLPFRPQLTEPTAIFKMDKVKWKMIREHIQERAFHIVKAPWTWRQ